MIETKQCLTQYQETWNTTYQYNIAGEKQIQLSVISTLRCAP